VGFTRRPPYLPIPDIYWRRFYERSFFGSPLFFVIAYFTLGEEQKIPDSLWVLSLIGVLFIGTVVAQRSPVITPLSDVSTNQSVFDGVYADEGRYYCPYTCLNLMGDYPQMNLVYLGMSQKAQGGVGQYGSVGFYGYYAGPRSYIIDTQALGDPLLAHLPGDNYRPGHTAHALPAGYVESVTYDENLIADASTHTLYNEVRQLTRGALFTAERWKTIWRFHFSPDFHLSLFMRALSLIVLALLVAYWGFLIACLNPRRWRG
jgi:arabinofuranosyltransferase